MPGISLLPWTKRPNQNDTAERDVPEWIVSFHPEVLKLIAKHGLDSPLFRPTLGQLISRLERDPKRFAKKQGRLRRARAADIRFADGAVWRAVFVLDESTRRVFVCALAPHDVAYNEAERRI
jgi:hypothetical protein